MLKPLIKYTGGKFKEYDKYKEFIPQNIQNYYEPFVGGGGNCLRLQNDNKIKGNITISDYSYDLINFYQSVKDENFAEELFKLNKAWDELKDFGMYFYEKYSERFMEYIHGKIEGDFLTEEAIDIINNLKIDYNFHDFSLTQEIIKEINNKVKRFCKKNIDEEEDVSEVALTTCICQAFYFIIRKMYNDWNAYDNKEKYTNLEMSAHWFFIREFCFCSMFRFGKNGEFNIPYGGFGYNKKNFKEKINNIISEETKSFFRNIDIIYGDFEEILNSKELKENDFIFLDPPYDSTFSEYDKNTFGKEEHKRLAECLKNCKCKWLMAIGKTDFILDLYKDYNIIEYDKTYMYQAKGTYDNKHTTHLIIKNYETPLCTVC